MFKITVKVKTDAGFEVERRVNASSVKRETVLALQKQGKYVDIIAEAGTACPAGFLMKGIRDKKGQWQPLTFDNGDYPIFASNIEVVEEF